MIVPTLCVGTIEVTQVSGPVEIPWERTCPRKDGEISAIFAGKPLPQSTPDTPKLSVIEGLTCKY